MSLRPRLSGGACLRAYVRVSGCAHLPVTVCSSVRVHVSLCPGMCLYMRLHVSLCTHVSGMCRSECMPMSP